VGRTSFNFWRCRFTHPPRFENTLPDGAAKVLPAQIKVESDNREQNRRRRSRQVEAIEAAATPVRSSSFRLLQLG